MSIDMQKIVHNIYPALKSGKEKLFEKLNYESEFNKMNEVFSHIHVNNQTDDFCKQCGLYITHPVHKRI